jgi:glycosyltransferase involved in cell wall biosynthesis
VLFEIARVARERGAAVHVLVNDWGASDIIRVAESIGATWSYTWVRAPLRRSKLTPPGIVAYAWEFARTSATLLAAAWRFRPTCVLLLDYTTALRNCFGLIALRAADVPVAMKLANAPETGVFYRRVWRWLVDPLVSTFVCNSLFTERELLSCGIAKRKVATIYNTLPTRRPLSTRPSRIPHRVVYVGQIIPEKGLAALFDAIELLLARGLRVTLDVVGAIDGWAHDEYLAWRSELRTRAESPPLRDVVRLLGWQEQVGEFFATAAVHCCPSLPSIRESFGLVVLEAKAAHVPSVVFRTGALPELVTHRRDGWICDEPTPEALADGLEYFLTDADRCSEAGQRAWESLVRFDRRRFADRWWTVVSESRRMSRGRLALPEMP